MMREGGGHGPRSNGRREPRSEREAEGPTRTRRHGEINRTFPFFPADTYDEMREADKGSSLTPGQTGQWARFKMTGCPDA